MADQHDVVEALIFDDAEHVGDVQREIDARVQLVRALAEAGEGGRKDTMSARAQPVGDAAPVPAAAPGAVDEDEGC